MESQFVDLIRLSGVNLFTYIYCIAFLTGAIIAGAVYILIAPIVHFFFAQHRFRNHPDRHLIDWRLKTLQ